MRILEEVFRLEGDFRSFEKYYLQCYQTRIDMNMLSSTETEVIVGGSIAENAKGPKYYYNFYL
jgi:hypothetical protein